MKEKFEKNIEQRLSKFALEPSAQVWQEVELALHPRRKDRKILWWWLPLAGLLLASGGWWLFSNTGKSNDNKISATNKNRKIIDRTVTIDKNKDSENYTAITTQRVSKIKKAPVLKQKVNRISNVAQTSKNRIAIRNINRNNSTVTVMENNSNEITTLPSSTGAINERKVNDKRKEKFADTSVTAIQETKTFQKNIDTSISVNKNNSTASNKNDSSTNKVTVKKNDQKKKGNKKQNWFITLGGGLIHVNQSNLFSTTFPSASSFATSGTSVSTGIPAASVGFNLYSGITYQYPINKRWMLNTGLLYHYLQNKQSVGSDSAAASSITYFRIGNISTKTNFAHWLQLPLSLGYNLNPSAKNKFQILLGSSLAWSVAEKWLVTDGNHLPYPYYYNASLNNRVIINLHAGINYNYKDRFQISLLAEQSLTPIHKLTTEKNYLRQFSLQIDKPLTRYKKKSLKK